MSTTTPIGFTGAYQDPVTSGNPLGNGYRWYLPELMRFNAPDIDSPFDIGGFNSYAYCDADPMNRTDPTGHAFMGFKMDEELISLLDSGLEHAAAADRPIAAPAQEPAHFEDLAPEQKRYGNVILRQWREFANQQRSIPDATRSLALSLGEQVTDSSTYGSLTRDEGRIIIQANGTSGDPTSGHSAIFHGFLQTSLGLSDNVNLEAPHVSKYGMSSQTAAFLNNKYETNIYRAGGHSIIEQNFAISGQELDDKLNHIAKKGNLFALHPKYSASFDEALRQTQERLHNGPYSYGFSYNCNTFVFDFLNRLRDLTP